MRTRRGDLAMLRSGPTHFLSLPWTWSLPWTCPGPNRSPLHLGKNIHAAIRIRSFLQQVKLIAHKHAVLLTFLAPKKRLCLEGGTPIKADKPRETSPTVDSGFPLISTHTDPRKPVFTRILEQQTRSTENSSDNDSLSEAIGQI